MNLSLQSSISLLILIFLIKPISLSSQKLLPVLTYHNLHETNNHYIFVWIPQNNNNHGKWLLEHSYNGLDWKILLNLNPNQNLYHYALPKNIYGLVRLRWMCSQDTSTLIVHNLNHTQNHGLFAYYDKTHCKVSIGYQLHYNTDLLLRFYNSIGEELATHFLYYSPKELHFWNFEPPNLKNDIYLVRLVDALSKKVLADFRLPIFYDSIEKKSN